MTYKDLEAWQLSLGITKKRAAELLGMSYSGYTGLSQRDSIDLRTELACAAIYFKLNSVAVWPWGSNNGQH